MSRIKLAGFIQDADFFFRKLLRDRSYNVQKKADVSADCIGYRCIKNGRFFTVYMYAFADKHISQLDGEFCSQLWDNPLSENSTVLVAYLQVKKTDSGPQICDYTGDPNGTIDFCQLITIKDRPVLLHFPSEEMHALFYKFVTAFNTGNADLYHTILTTDNCYLHGYDVPGYFTNEAVYHSLRKFHKEYGKMKTGYVRFTFNDVIYNRVAYLDGLGYFGISVTDDHKYIQGIEYYPFNNPKILEFIKTDEESAYSISNIPSAARIVPLPPIQSERFAVKIYFMNGECRKYVLPEDSTGETVSYNGHSFTDNIWRNGRLVQTHKSPIPDYPDGGQAIEFTNGYHLPVIECYERGTRYTEPTICNEVMYQDKKIKITKLWDWNVEAIYEDNGSLADEDNEKGTGVLNILLEGSAFNWYSTSTLAYKDGTRCSLDFCYLDSSRTGWFNVGVYGRGYNFINSDFKFLNKDYYRDSRDFSGKYAKVAKDGEIFYVDRKGREIHIKPSHKDTKYVRYGNFIEGLARVSTLNIGLYDLAFHSDDESAAGTWGYVDETGREIIKPQYIYAYDFSNGIAIVCKGKWENKKWPHRDHYCEGYWSESAKWGAIDKTGKTVIPFKFDSITVLNNSDDLFRVHYGGWENGKYGIIDNKGNWVVEPQFNYITYEFEHDLLVFADNDYDDKFGLYDAKAGKIIFEPMYYDVEVLHNGDICLEVLNSESGRRTCRIIDRKGNEKSAFDCSYVSERITRDKKRYYLLFGDGKKGLADAETGEIIFDHDSRWDKFFIEEQRILFTENGKKGICDFSQNIIVPARYDDIIECCYNPDFYEVKIGKEYMKDARYGLLKKDGTEVLPHKYMRIAFCMDGKHIICKDENSCSLLRLDMVPATKDNAKL
jgi:hypothetical protein